MENPKPILLIGLAANGLTEDMASKYVKSVRESLNDNSVHNEYHVIIYSMPYATENHHQLLSLK